MASAAYVKAFWGFLLYASLTDKIVKFMLKKKIELIEVNKEKYYIHPGIIATPSAGATLKILRKTLVAQLMVKVD